MIPEYKRFGKKKNADYSEKEKTVVKDFKDRFSKWHLKQIDTFTLLTNILFTLSVAISGFIISNQDQYFFKNKIFFNNLELARTSLFLLILSATCGIVALISRLNDFSLTKNLIKVRRRIFELDNDIRYEDKMPSDKDLLIKRKEDLIYKSKILGRCTKILFYLQLVTFVTVLWALVLSV